ncbi:MAG: phosphoribosylanthranilate isomerase [Candidatus Hydrothermarchaeales archaeon]
MVKVKICGITSVRDALECVRLGADFIGTIVEVPVATPRKISADLAKGIHRSLPLLALGVVVMMPQTIKEALHMTEEIRPYAIQLHGNENIEFVKKLREKLETKIIKTIHVQDESAIEDAREYSKYCDAILLDTMTEELGGSGITHDWEISRKIVKSVDRPVILAGGLNPENVKEAIEKVCPYAVDVSSGVESKEGRKDYDKVERFIENVGGA